MTLKVRTPFIGEVVTMKSPLDEDISFGIKRVGAREVMAHRDRNSVVRYIQRDEGGEFITEKDYPVGTMRLDTVLLCLDSWNISHDGLNPLKIDRDAVLGHLDPEEIDALYDKSLEVNPILNPAGGKDARKND